MNDFQRELCFELVYYVALCASASQAQDQAAILQVEAETPLKTLEQVNKTYKQQVWTLIIAPLALGPHNMLNKCFGKHSQPNSQKRCHTMSRTTEHVQT